MWAVEDDVAVSSAIGRKPSTLGLSRSLDLDTRSSREILRFCLDSYCLGGISRDMNPLAGLLSRWKALRLPWRKSFMVGSDLNGNTFWEFKESWNAVRLRRIVKYNPKTHYADVKVTPQWHQWLRYVRNDPPSIAEQQQDVIRQLQIKQLAQLADERWASKPSYLDKPQMEHPQPALKTSDGTVQGPAQGTPQARHEKQQQQPHPTQNEATQATSQQQSEQQEKRAQHKLNKNKKDDPWAAATPGTPGQDWEPDSWTPSAARR